MLHLAGNNNEMQLMGTEAGDLLTGDAKIIYGRLKEKVESIALNGGATEFSINCEDLSINRTWRPSDFEFSSFGTEGSNNYNYAANQISEVISAAFSDAFNALMVDCPYDLYWFDKTTPYNCSPGYRWWINGSGVVTAFELGDMPLNFTVAAAYQDSDAADPSHTVSKALAEGTKDAVEFAGEIVEENKDKTDYQKLAAYRERICAETDYNDEAVKPTYTGGYGDPWQLIYVFDKDENTKVVCEGYSKAFQLLCDLSKFDAAQSRIVTGYMSGATGEGGHMWNVVTMEDEKNYLVDVTNCDQGTVGAPDKLFLRGYSAIQDGWYRLDVENTGKTDYVFYIYKEMIWPEELLALAEADYDPEIAPYTAVDGLAVGEDGAVTATVHVAPDVTCQAYIAFYSETGQMLGIKCAELRPGINRLTEALPAGTARTKVMVVDADSAPLCACKTAG